MLVGIRLTLWFGSYRTVLKRIASLTPRNEPFLSIQMLADAVDLTARCVPGASCLTQALSLRYLAAREGIECTIRIGVKTQSDGSFEAHAWVTAHGSIIIGGKLEEVTTFMPIVDL